MGRFSTMIPPIFSVMPEVEILLDFVIDKVCGLGIGQVTLVQSKEYGLIVGFYQN